MAPRTEQQFKGAGVSRGIVSGPALLLKPADPALPDREISPEQVPAEQERLAVALEETRSQLKRIQKQVSEAMGSESAEIFEAHLHVLDDPGFLDEVRRELEKRRLSIETVLSDVSERYADTLLKMEDDYLRERVADLRDVTRRILRNLTGGGGHLLQRLNSPHIVVAPDIPPSEMAGLDRRHVLGVLTEQGSTTSHTAILARAMDLPAVVGVEGICGRIADGDRLLMDGVRGLVVLHPTPEHEEEFGRIAHTRSTIRARLDALKDRDAVTPDGHAVVLSANIEMPSDVDSVREFGAKGVGLYRSEYLYLVNRGDPTEEIQYQTYAEIARKMMPDPVIIRTLDLGGDKFPDSFGMPPETNPFLGCRAIRLCLDRPEMFKTQLRALLRAAEHNPNLRIMYPMVSRAGEIDQANALLAECRMELTEEDIPFRGDLEVGVMVEIPSAALMADRLAQKVAFFSIGTNDLVQYTLAVDRVNERIAHLYDPMHPAVLELMQRTIDASHRHGIWTGVCGEVAGNPLMLPLLVGMGVDELSTSPSTVPIVKEVIRHLPFAEARKLAQEVLTLSNGAEIRNRCRELVRRIAPEMLELAE